MTSEQEVLKRIGTPIFIRRDKPFYPRTFFLRGGNKKWADTWLNFRAITEKAKILKPPLEAGLLPYEVVRPANATRIHSELPKGHNFDASSLCWVVGEMAFRQSQGQAGDLIVNGHNIFPYGEGMVFVHWLSQEQFWQFGEKSFVELWPKGTRLFSPNLLPVLT